MMIYFRIPVIAAVVLLAVVTLPAAASADTDLPKLLQTIQQEMQQNRPQQAIETARLALLAVWSRTPLFVAKSSLVKQKASGFGMYQVRGDNVYKKGEPILLYVEPAGYVIKKEGDLYSFKLQADFEVSKPDGSIIGGKKNFGQWVLKSHRTNFEFFLNLTYTLSGLGPGEYTIQTTVRDVEGQKEASVSTPIKIR